jgi:predicted nuclease with RNAse H fold
LFFGIGFTSVEAKPSACVGLDSELNLIYSGFPHRDLDLIRVVSRHGLEMVAIDAPLSLPEGLCCLEESFPCHPKAGLQAGVVNGN